MHSQFSHQFDFAAPALQRILKTSGQLFQRKLTLELDAFDVEAAMPGLDVSDSTWDDWAAASAEQAARIY